MNNKYKIKYKWKPALVHVAHHLPEVDGYKLDLNGQYIEVLTDFNGKPYANIYTHVPVGLHEDIECGIRLENLNCPIRCRAKTKDELMDIIDEIVQESVNECMELLEEVKL